jgi:Family of unknown function (DUF6141)
MRGKKAKTLFHEEQAFHQIWVWALLIVILAFATGLFTWALYVQLVQGKPWGDKPMSDTGLIITSVLVFLFSAGLIVLFVMMRLVTEVREDGLYVRFVPFHFSPKRIDLTALESHRALTYSPIKEYGGWGIRHRRGRKAYNVSGNEGVRLDFKNDKHLLIGSQKAKKLERAIATLLNFSKENK